jgi:hypothetical protein
MLNMSVSVFVSSGVCGCGVWSVNWFYGFNQGLNEFIIFDILSTQSQ